MLFRTPYILSFVLTVCCWLRENAAVPLVSDLSVASQMRDLFEEKRVDSQDNWHDAASQLRRKRNVEPKISSLDDTLSDELASSESEESSNNVRINNQNVNVNVLSSQRGWEKSRKRPAPAPITATYGPKTFQVKEDRSCMSGKKKNQRYSSSFVNNVTNQQLAVDKEFDDVIGNSKAKTTSSVHVGEDITLCWIETTTIKEDKSTQPPKRLVIREYTISFENSATIPDRYLECERLEGEVTPNDPDIDKTALFEVIDEDTKASKVVNFTAVRNVGHLLVWQHKRVKCGVGPVVKKNIIEWNDGSDNPKKRVEIKVSPNMRQLTAKKPEEEPCTEEIDESSTEFNRSTESCENSTESGSCETTTRSDEGPKRRPDSDGVEEDIVTELSSDEFDSAEVSGGESNTEGPLLPFTDHKTSTLPHDTMISKLMSTTIPPIPLKKKHKLVPLSEECEDSSLGLECAISASGASLSKEVPVESSTIEDKSEERTITEFSHVFHPETEEGSVPKGVDKDSFATSVEVDNITPESFPSSEEISSEDSKETVTIKTMDQVTTIEPEIIGTKHIPMVITTTSVPKSVPTMLSPTSSDETDYDCENSEDCTHATSSAVCDETGNCRTTSGSCESGECLNEDNTEYSEHETIMPVKEVEAVSTTMTALTSDGAENGSTVLNSAPTTVESRRSTLSSATTAKPKQKFTLMVKILLQHVNDKEEKQNLVEVEKKLLLNENPKHRQRAPDELLEQLKSLNDSVNVETMSALLNCTSLNKLVKDANFVRVVDPTVGSLEGAELLEDPREHNSAEVDIEQEDSQSLDSNEEIVLESHRRRRRSLDANTTIADSNSTMADANLTMADANSTLLNVDEIEVTYIEQVHLDLNESSTPDLNNTSSTSRDELLYETTLPTEESTQSFTTTLNPEGKTTDSVYVENEGNVTKEKTEGELDTQTKSASKEVKIVVIEETLPGIKEDVSTGLMHVMSELTNGNLTLAKDDKELAKVNLMSIPLNPKGGKIFSRRRRETTEEVGRWSNERISKVSLLGGNLRSITEFTLYKISP